MINPPQAPPPQQAFPVPKTNLATTPKPDEPGISNGRAPSRKRDLRTLLERAASCGQPHRAAQPNIVSPKLLTIQGHLWVAQNDDARNFFRGKAVTPDYRAIADAIITTPHERYQGGSRSYPNYAEWAENYKIRKRVGIIPYPMIARLMR